MEEVEERKERVKECSHGGDSIEGVVSDCRHSGFEQVGLSGGGGRKERRSFKFPIRSSSLKVDRYLFKLQLGQA